MTTNSRPSTEVQRTRRGYVRPTAITLLVLALIGGLVLWSQPPQLDPGDQILGGESSAENATERFAVLPSGGEMRLAVGTVNRQMDGGATYSPEEGRLVRVEWDIERSLRPAFIWRGAPAAARREPPVRIVLQVGDRTYPVADDVRTTSADGSVTTRVAGSGALAVAAISGGRELPMTRARPELFRESDDGSPACYPEGPAVKPTAQTVRGVESYVTCDLETSRAAWIAGLGWAPAGQEWIVARGAAATGGGVGEWDSGRGEPSTHYRAAVAPTLRLSVSGARPQRTAADAQPGSAVRDAATPTTAFLVPTESDVDVTLTVTLRAEKFTRDDDSAPDPEAPESVTFTLRQGVRSAGLQ